MQNFKELQIWQKSVEVALVVYNVTKDFPVEERYGLTAQMRSAAISIPSNIAEGHMRKTNKDFQQFIAIARGSGAELETQALIAFQLKYLSEKNYSFLFNKIEELAKMLSVFYSKLTS